MNGVDKILGARKSGSNTTVSGVRLSFSSLSLTLTYLEAHEVVLIASLGIGGVGIDGASEDTAERESRESQEEEERFHS